VVHCLFLVLPRKLVKVVHNILNWAPLLVMEQRKGIGVKDGSLCIY
jgi:hypothetical protein